jgi:Flp pilus assembly pilin Flp
MDILKSIWSDDVGFIVSIELILIATIMVIGLITGFTAVRDAVVCELSDVGGAIQDLNQSYTFNGVTGHSGNTAGSDFLDARDHCDDRDDIANRADNCIVFTTRPANER